MARRSRRACSAACSPAVVIIGDLIVAVEDVIDMVPGSGDDTAVGLMLPTWSSADVERGGEGECASSDELGGEEDAWEEDSAEVSAAMEARASWRSCSASIS